VKTLKKSQRNVEESIVPNEVLSLTRIHQTQREDSHCQHCVRIFDVYEDDEFVHLVLENCRGDPISHVLEMQTDLENPC
jgi:serine/threonine protein kinase